jgi:tetratricopeptide (TPR) repeat protein
MPSCNNAGLDGLVHRRGGKVAEAGWHRDPSGRHQYRYWDGRVWTAHVANDGVVAIDERGPASAAPGVISASGDDEAAIAAYRQADAQGDAKGSVLLGQALRRAGKTDLALAAFERGEARGHREAAMCIGNMLKDLGNAVGARRAYERGIAAGSTMAVLNLGLMLASAGEVDDALRYLRMARQHDEPEAHWAVGRLLEDKGDRAGAAESYRAGAAAGFAPAAYGLGTVLYEMGDKAGAKAAFQRADDLGDEGAKEVLAALAREETPAAPDEGLARQLVPRLAAACKEVMRLHASCSESSVMVQKAHYVASQPQAPASRASFLKAAERHTQEFLTRLSAFTTAQTAARELWSQLLFASGAPDTGMDKVLVSLLKQGSVQKAELSDIMVGGIMVKANFGSTMDEFLEVDAKLAQLMESSLGS